MRLILIFLFSFFLLQEIVPAPNYHFDTPQNYQVDTGSEIHPVNFKPEKISEYKSDKAFEYINAEEKDNWWTRTKRWVNMRYQEILDWLFGDYEANNILAFFLQILPYLLLGAIIGLVVWLFIRLDPGTNLLKESVKSEVIFNEEEKIVRSRNIPQLIEEAVRQGNYRLAIRYYYLQLLKQLNEKGVINYETQKTNSEYLSEINIEIFREPFRKLMRIYDFSWYGGFAISEGNFQSAQQSFREMEDLLKRSRDEQ